MFSFGQSVGLSLPTTNRRFGGIGQRSGAEPTCALHCPACLASFAFDLRKGLTMSDSKLPLIHKAPVEGLTIHVARTGLSIGDSAWLERLSDGRIGVFARLRKPILGLIPHHRDGLVGHLGPVAEEIIAPSLAHGDDLRVRIIDLTPEHLANGYPPEVYISVWGDPRHLQPILSSVDLPEPPPEPRAKAPKGLSGLRPA